MLSPDLMLDSGPPPQAVLDKRWLWKILLALLGLTLLLRLLGLDVAGAILSALMLWFAVVMTRDGMAEVGKYSFIYGVLCALNFFFDLLPLITELGGRVTRTRQAVGTGMTPDGGKQTTYTLTTKTTPFFDSAEGFVYNVQSVAMIVAPIAMALGLHLSMSAHNEFARLMPSSDDDWVRFAVTEGFLRETMMPDDIRSVPPEELCSLIRATKCVPVDVRDVGVDGGMAMQGAERLSYCQLLSNPEELVPKIAKLRQAGKPAVFFSDQGGRMGRCALIGAILIDVFGLEEESVLRLDGGYVAWDAWLEANRDQARTVEPLALRLQRRRAAAAIRQASESASSAPAPSSSSAQPDPNGTPSVPRPVDSLLGQSQDSETEVAKDHLETTVFAGSTTGGAAAGA